MEMIREHAVPEPHVLRSFGAQNLSWVSAMCELIDNALDAGATVVEISTGDTDGNGCSIRDNGRGVAKIADLVTLGRHREHDTTKLGMFGVGFKGAATNLSDFVSIESRCKDQTLRKELHWYSGFDADWGYDVEVEHEDNARTGLRLDFGQLRRRARLADASRIFGYTFAPFMRGGGRLTIESGRKPTIVEPYEPPRLERARAIDGALAGGQRFSGRAGIVPSPHANPHSGFNVSFEHRQIFAVKAIGDRPTGANFYAEIRLLGSREDWRLSTYKDDIDERLRDELEDALAERCHDLIEEAAEAQHIVGVSELERLLAIRGPSKPGSKSGGGRARGEPGDDSEPARRRKGGLRIVPARLGPHRLWTFAPTSGDESVTFEINIEVPFIDRALREDPGRLVPIVAPVVGYGASRGPEKLQRKLFHDFVDADEDEKIQRFVRLAIESMERAR